MKKPLLVILGATSAIARESALCLAKEGNHLLLVGKDEEELRRISSDIFLRSAVEPKIYTLDVANRSKFGPFFSLFEKDPPFGVLSFVGLMGNQKEDEQNLEGMERVLSVNFTLLAHIFSFFANLLEQEKKGFLLGVTSVAGMRGRMSNYIYGSAKGGFSLFLSGLRNRLYRSQVAVYDVRLGFIDTGMTYGKPGIFLPMNPKTAGRKIAALKDSRKNIVYFPFFWRWIMMIVCSLPESLFKRLKL